MSRVVRAPIEAPIGASTPGSTGRSTRSSMIASAPSVVWLIWAASMFTAASPSSVPTRPITPGRSAYSSTIDLALGAQVEVPAVDLHQLLHLGPPGQRAGDGDRLAVGHRGAQLHDAAVVVALGGRWAAATPTPRSAASAGTFTKVTCSSTTLVNTPRSAASCSTDTSSAASSPETSTVTGAGHPPGQRVQHRAELLGERQPGPHLLADDAGHLHVHRVRHELAGQRELHGPGDVGAGAVLGLVGGRAEVRGDDDLRQLEQRAGGGRLGDVDVDAGAADVPAADGLGQRLLVDQAAAGGVDDQHARLGQRQLVLADEPEGLGGLGQVDRDQVGAAQQVVQAHQLDAELRGAGRRDVGVVGDQPDVERGEALRDQLTDLARGRRRRRSCR